MPAQSDSRVSGRARGARTFGWISVVVLWVLASPLWLTLPGEAEAAERQSLMSARDEKAIDSLKREFDWEMEQVPIREVAETVRKWCGINVCIDTKALDEVGVDADVTLTLHGKKISADVALERMLMPLELTWTLENGILLLTTPEVAEVHLSTRIYNVRDLLAKSFRSDGSTSYDFDSLIELISGAIQPNTWDSVGGPSSIEVYNNDFDVALVISQTHIAHREIDEFFCLLRSLPSDGRRTRQASGEANAGGRRYSSRTRASGAAVPYRQTVLAPAWPPISVQE